MEDLIKVLGYLYYWGYMIWCFFDNNANTPTNIVGDYQPWDGWPYYVEQIIVHFCLFPIWVWIWDIIGGGIGAGIDEWIEEKLK